MSVSSRRQAAHRWSNGRGDPHCWFIELAVLAATAGDGEAALRHAAASLAHRPSPEIGRDILRARPELDALRETPAWQALLGPDDRTLQAR